MKGYYGEFGGQFVPETLIPALDELEGVFATALNDPDFIAELDEYLVEYVGRPSPLTYAKRLSEHFGLDIWLKREDLNHTGSHKINNVIGQILLAKRMGKKRVVAETGAGQHGVATATACALMGIDCVVYMGAVDVARQRLNAERMRLLGAQLVAVESGSRTLKDATSEAIRDWAANVDDTYYLLGSALGPHPYPAIVKHFQSIIGREARAQMLKKTGQLPDAVIACVGGGSNAIGIFSAFIDDKVELIGVEAYGDQQRHGASINFGRPGVLHGTYSYLLQDENGQVEEAYSIAAGLDYPSVGPEHSYLASIGRVNYGLVTDAEALDAFNLLNRLEGIAPALESSHALAYLSKYAPEHQGKTVIVNVSGRGDKDLHTILGEE